MLIQRIFTAIPLAAIVLWATLTQPTETLIWLFLAATLPAAWEWSRLSGLAPPALQFLYVIGVLMVSVVLAYDQIGLAQDALWLAVVIWLVIAVVLPFYRLRELRKPSWSKMLLGIVLIPAALVAMVQVHHLHGGSWLLYGLMLVWVADIGAYFAGRRFGRHKLAPALSPGKTIEGAVGAVVATLIYSAIAGTYFELDNDGLLLLLLLAFVLTLISIAGDLFESVLKRERGVKDSGQLLPGHGGMLDRIDSILAAMPVFAVGVGLVLGNGVMA